MTSNQYNFFYLKVYFFNDGNLNVYIILSSILFNVQNRASTTVYFLLETIKALDILQ
jgi:hypothetical protein